MTFVKAWTYYRDQFCNPRRQKVDYNVAWILYDSNDRVSCWSSISTAFSSPLQLCEYPADKHGIHTYIHTWYKCLQLVPYVLVHTFLFCFDCTALCNLHSVVWSFPVVVVGLTFPLSRLLYSMLMMVVLYCVGILH